MSKIVVLYHGPSCPDGFASAYAAWTVLGDAAMYLPVRYGEQPPGEALLADRLYILDFSYPREKLLGLAGLVSNGALDGPAVVTVLDHHKTAREALDGLQAPGLEIIFDMEKSGAVLVWEYFHPGKPVPLLLKYVQDRDLWKWKLPRSREFSAGLSIEPRTFERWRDLIDGGFRDRICNNGRAILTAQRQHVESMASHAFMTTVGGYVVPAVNSPIFQSEIGELLCERHPEMLFAAIFFVTETDEQWSLRSRGEFDVSAVAKALGGGGHRNASGFRRPRG
jgi:uncharacterized protein